MKLKDMKRTRKRRPSRVSRAGHDRKGQSHYEVSVEGPKGAVDKALREADLTFDIDPAATQEDDQPADHGTAEALASRNGATGYGSRGPQTDSPAERGRRDAGSHHHGGHPSHCGPRHLLVSSIRCFRSSCRPGGVSGGPSALLVRGRGFVPGGRQSQRPHSIQQPVSAECGRECLPGPSDRRRVVRAGAVDAGLSLQSVPGRRAVGRAPDVLGWEPVAVLTEDRMAAIVQTATGAR